MKYDLTKKEIEMMVTKPKYKHLGDLLLYLVVYNPALIEMGDKVSIKRIFYLLKEVLFDSGNFYFEETKPTSSKYKHTYYIKCYDNSIYL